MDDDPTREHPWLAERDQQLALALVLDVAEVLTRATATRRQPEARSSTSPPGCTTPYTGTGRHRCTEPPPPPATDHRPPTTGHRPPTTDHRPPTTDHRPPTTDHRPPTTDHTIPQTQWSLYAASGIEILMPSG